MTIIDIIKEEYLKLRESIIANHSTQTRFIPDIHKYGFEGERIFRTPNTEVIPIWFTPINLEQYTSSSDEISNITVKLNINNTFNPLNKNERDKLQQYAIKTYGNEYHYLSDDISHGDWESMENHFDGSIPALIKELGYDSFISIEGEGETYAVFDGKNVEIIK